MTELETFPALLEGLGVSQVVGQHARLCADRGTPKGGCDPGHAKKSTKKKFRFRPWEKSVWVQRGVVEERV